MESEDHIPDKEDID
jgi:hypothetical protein